MRRLFKLRPGEGSQFAILFFYYFCVVAITIAGKTARDSYFLSRYDRSLLALMSGAGAATVAVAAALFSRLSARAGLLRATRITGLLFAVSLAALYSRVHGVLIPAFYVWIEVVFVVAALQFWLLAPAIFDPRQARRLFGPLAAGGSLGAIAAGVAMKPFVQMWGVDATLLLLAALIGAATMLASAAARYVVQEQAAAAAPDSGAAPRKDGYLMSIAAAVAMAAAATTVIEYQFKIFAGTAYPRESDLAGFFGNFYAATGLSTLIAQFALTGFLLSRFGVLAGLLTLPVLLGASSAAVLVAPTLAAASLAKFSDQTLKFTLTNSTMELLWLPVAAARRLRVKPFVTGAVKAAAEAASSVALYFLARSVSLAGLSWLALAATAVWIGAAFRLRSLYVRQIGQAIENRRLAVAELNIDAGDPVIARTLREALLGGQDEQVLFALRLIEGLPARYWAGPLQSLLLHAAPAVKRRVLEVAGDDPEALPDFALVTAIAANDAASAPAFLAAARRNHDAFLPLMRSLLDSPNPELRAAAANGLRDRAVLDSMLRSDDPAHAAAAIPYAAGDPAALPQPRLTSLLQSRHAEIRAAALHALGDRADPSALPAIVQLIALHPAATRETLQRFPADAAASALIEDFADAPAARRMEILRALAAYPSPDVARHLLAAADPQHSDETAAALESLVTVSRTLPLASEHNAAISSVISALAERGYFCNRVLTLLPAAPAEPLLRDYYSNHLDRMAASIVRAAAVRRPAAPVETCVRILRARDTRRLGFVLELLDALLTREERRVAGPLLEVIRIEERDRTGAAVFPDLPVNLADVLLRSVNAGQAWLAAISFDCLRRTRPDLLEIADPQSKRRNPFIAEFLTRGTMPEAMFTTLEKAVFLKSVGLFQKVPAERISDLAQVAQVTQVAAGTTLFHDGDHGDSLYLVVAGSVRVHKGGQQLAVLGKGGCVGEMSLLDQEPRSADVTSIEETTLLRIGQEEFYEVLRRHQEVVQGVIGLLTARLRAANANLSGSFVVPPQK